MRISYATLVMLARLGDLSAATALAKSHDSPRHVYVLHGRFVTLCAARSS